MEWYNEAKCVVCLTFDFDADVSWRNILKRHNIERNNPVVLSQRQYGAKAGVPRILKLLKKSDMNKDARKIDSKNEHKERCVVCNSF